jgi:hypothetical protein
VTRDDWPAFRASSFMAASTSLSDATAWWLARAWPDTSDCRRRRWAHGSGTMRNQISDALEGFAGIR